MAEPSRPTSVFTTAEKPKNLIVINYECPPDPNHSNCILWKVPKYMDFGRKVIYNIYKDNLRALCY